MSASASSLYGVGTAAGNVHWLTTINTSTAALTPQFSFSVPSNVTGVFGLTYIPATNRFITVGQIGPSNAALIEINPVTQTASQITTSIAGFSYFEGLEYSSTLNQLVVSVGPGGFFTGRLAFLDPSSYSLLSSNTSTGLQDSDILFTDATGALNVLDDNTPSNGAWRNIVNNPALPSTLTAVGSNFWSSLSLPIQDFAYKSDDTNLYATDFRSLHIVNGPSTGQSLVGNYGFITPGAAFEMKGIAVASEPVPEPATLVLGAAGLLGAIRRRRQRTRA